MGEQTKDRLFDLSGTTTGKPVTKKMVVYIVLALVAIFGGMLLPLGAYGPKAGLGLGFFIAVILLYLSQCFSIEAISLMMAGVGFLLEFWTWADVQTSTGTSSFLQMLCMFVVAAGANTTPIGK